MFSIVTLSLLALSASSTWAATTVHVKTAAELTSALANAKAGEVIELADGDYHGTFVGKGTGTAENGITLTGSKKAAISGPNYGLHLENANHWTLKGFSIHTAKKGLVLDHSSNNVIDNIEVHNIDEEGIHFRKDSAHNRLENSHIHHTGLKTPGFGEGVYIGSAVKNWENGKPDRSDYNVISNNKIGPNVAAESIDIKEGTCCGHISGNHFDGTGMKGEHFADSWVDVKGDKYVLENNTGENAIKDGIEVHHQTEALSGVRSIGLLGGCHNTIKGQKCSGIHGVCVHVEVKDSTVVTHGDCPNTVEN